MVSQAWWCIGGTETEGLLAILLSKDFPSYRFRAYTRDKVEVLTGVHSDPDGDPDLKTELHDDKCIEDGRDPFVLSRYGVSSVMVKMSVRNQIGEGTLYL